MKNVKFSIGQKFDREFKGVTLNKDVTFNSASYELEEINSLNMNSLCWGFVNAIFRRFEAKEAGVKIDFSYTQPINLKVSIDGQTAFNLAELATKSGVNIKFPTFLARKDPKEARRVLASNVSFAIENAQLFNDDMLKAVE